LSEAQRREEEAWRDVPDPYDVDDMYEQDVLHGRTAADISHAGEAMNDEAAADAGQSLLEQLRAHHKYVFFFCILFLQHHR
jgi:hypothetical protein